MVRPAEDDIPAGDRRGAEFKMIVHQLAQNLLGKDNSLETEDQPGW